MLDDLRNTSDSLIEDDDSDIEFYDPGDIDDFDEPGGGMFLGMTPPQRFVIALMLMMITCLLGAGCLILTGKMVLPIG